MRRLVTRRRLAELNRQEWEDFRAHWPMRLFEFARDIASGVILGVLLGLSMVLYVLEHVLS